MDEQEFLDLMGELREYLYFEGDGPSLMHDWDDKDIPFEEVIERLAPLYKLLNRLFFAHPYCIK